MKFDKFIETYKVGKGYDYDGVYGCQCVDLAKFYIDKVLEATPQSIGDAKEYWKKRNQAYIKSLFKAVKGNAAARGDVFVRDSGEHGHIGMVLSVDKDGFAAIEQNAGNCGTVKHLYHRFASDIHFLRPLNQANISNKPELNAGDKVKLLANNICYVRAARKDAFTVADLTAFKCGETAQLKKGTKLTAKAVDTVSGDMWVKASVGGIEVYLYAYNKKKDKAYIKKA